MALVSKPELWRNRSRLAAVGTMLLLWLGLYALEVSPDLHRFLHQDAQNSAHNCLVTQLRHHSVLSGFAPSLLPAAPVTWSFVQPHPTFVLFSSVDLRLSPSRAPPSV